MDEKIFRATEPRSIHRALPIARIILEQFQFFRKGLCGIVEKKVWIAPPRAPWGYPCCGKFQMEREEI
jgi:hypothetical protein